MKNVRYCKSNKWEFAICNFLEIKIINNIIYESIKIIN